jgi:putative ABC transport system substrate-binding protein
MLRREFIAGLGSAALWPLVARAQQAALPLIGYLGVQSADDDSIRTVPFLRGLKETGYVEGQNVAIEYRWAENQPDRIPALAADLVRRRVAVIVAADTAAALVAKAATTTIPVVFVSGGDPVALGLVARLNRPGANLTGSANLTVELGPKQLQLLHELLPNAARFGVLADILRGAKPGDLPVQFPAKYEMAVNLKTAKALGLTVPQSILLRADEVIE